MLISNSIDLIPDLDHYLHFSLKCDYTTIIAIITTVMVTTTTNNNNYR